MSDYKTVYLIVERGMTPNKQTYWRVAGSAVVCRDGSLNLQLDIHPGLAFVVRDAKSTTEVQSAAADRWPTKGIEPTSADDIPF